MFFTNISYYKTTNHCFLLMIANHSISSHETVEHIFYNKSGTPKCTSHDDTINNIPLIKA